MYFKSFPNIYYNFMTDNGEELRVVKDITTNVRLRKKVLELISVYDVYDIQDGETPETIAFNYYGNALYHWIIMLANERYDITTDWPMSYSVLNSYIQDKYNYYTAESWYVSSVSQNRTVVTVYAPSHGLTADTISSSMTNPITVSDMLMTTSSSILNDTIVLPVEGLSSTGTILTGSGDITANTLKIQFDGTISNGTPDGWPVDESITYTWLPYNGLKFNTSNREYLISHYESDKGFVVEPSVADCVPITYYDKEVRANDAKRRIKLVASNVIGVILDDLKTLINT